MDNTLLLLLAGGAALYFFTQKKDGETDKSTMSEAEAAVQIRREETRQKELELEYLKQASERDWEDVALDFFGGAAKTGGAAVGGWLGQISF